MKIRSSCNNYRKILRKKYHNDFTFLNDFAESLDSSMQLHAIYIVLLNFWQTLFMKLAVAVLVCPQTFSHSVMCKVCLTASNTLFGRICTAKSLNSIECLAREVFKCVAEHIFLNTQYNLLAIHLVGFSANLRTRKLRLMSSLYKDTFR